MVKRGEVYWVNLDPTIGTEIRKTRPALIISP
ncbi:MAG: growth inhibitor PemK, partial [Deltaproteobacteria bacterium HGW-Deltaproteobacteria-16]